MSGPLSFMRRGNGDKQSEIIRYPLRRVDSLLRRFFKVFQVNLDRMYLHKINIQKFMATDNVPDLTREYVYSLQSVHQLTATVEQIKQIRSQVELEDLVALDHRLTNLFNGAILLLAEFLLLNNDRSPDEVDNSNKLRRAFSTSDGDDSAKVVPRLCRQQSLMQLVQVDRVDCWQSWIRLKSKLLQFHDTMQKLFLLIETHSSTEAELLACTSEEPTDSQSPTMSSQLKCLMLPVAGAVLGGAIGGPVGFVAGLKAAKMVAVGGSLLGGTFLKKKKDEPCSTTTAETLSTSDETSGSKTDEATSNDDDNASHNALDETV